MWPPQPGPQAESLAVGDGWMVAPKGVTGRRKAPVGVSDNLCRVPKWKQLTAPQTPDTRGRGHRPRTPQAGRLGPQGVGSSCLIYLEKSAGVKHKQVQGNQLQVRKRLRSDRSRPGSPRWAPGMGAEPRSGGGQQGAWPKLRQVCAEGLRGGGRGPVLGARPAPSLAVSWAVPCVIFTRRAVEEVPPEVCRVPREGGNATAFSVAGSPPSPRPWVCARRDSRLLSPLPGPPLLPPEASP